MHATLEALLSHKPLTLAETQGLFAAMLSGELTDAQIGAVLAAWRLCKVGSDELYAGASVMRAQATPVKLPGDPRPLIDNCGTGGDGSHSFNISTAAAIVAASAGARVAKHGNRSVSSKCGSADLLFAAGLPQDLTPDGTAELLASTGFTFFYAPNYHPALKHVAAARKQLKVRTIFNLLGPLANPLAPDLQLIGVGSPLELRPMAEALVRLGTKRSMVVHSRDGLDEISCADLTDALLIHDKQISPLLIDPTAYDCAAPRSAFAGGDADHNLGLLNSLFAGAAPGLAAVVALNAGAVLWLAGTAASLEAGVALAQRQISSKAARDYFASWLRAAIALAPS